MILKLKNLQDKGDDSEDVKTVVTTNSVVTTTTVTTTTTTQKMKTVDGVVKNMQETVTSTNSVDVKSEVKTRLKNLKNLCIFFF